MFRVETAAPLTTRPRRGRFEVWAHHWNKNLPRESARFRVWCMDANETVGRRLGLPDSVPEPRLVINALAEFHPRIQGRGLIRPEALATLSLLHVFTETSIPSGERRQQTNVLMRAASPLSYKWSDQQLRLDTPPEIDSSGKGLIEVDGTSYPIASVPLTQQEEARVAYCTAVPAIRPANWPTVYTLLHYVCDEAGGTSLLERIQPPDSGPRYVGGF